MLLETVGFRLEFPRASRHTNQPEMDPRSVAELKADPSIVTSAPASGAPETESLTTREIVPVVD
jgi:hypothetical protein